MRLGNKIKQYRVLRNLSQKELGMKVGFSAATADSRIRKYESDTMAPKADIRAKIAEALDIDIEAISDVEITSFEDVMYVLFELEEQFGMTIEKKDGKTSLVFDDDNYNIESLISYLNMWKNKKDALMPEDKISYEENQKQLKDYLSWKSHFKSEIEEYYKTKEDAINTKYADSVKKYSKTANYATTTSDIVLLFRNMIEEGLDLKVWSNTDRQGFTFNVNEILNPPTEKAEGFFTRFLSEMENISRLGAKTHTDMQIPDKSVYITYYVDVRDYQPIVSLTQKYLDYRANCEGQSDFYKDEFESSFRTDLEMICNRIDNDAR